MEETYTKKRSNIDSGWAWMVMVTSYLGTIILAIALYINGVIYVELLGQYGEGEAKTSLVGALCSGFLCCAAPIVGALNNKISCRFSIVLGGAVSTIGFAVCGFVSSLNLIIFFNGFIVGVGFALSMSGLVCVVGFYFEKYRDIVLSVIFSTVGISMFVSAPFGLFLLSECGLKATYLILASIMAHMCVIGMLSRPSKIEKEVQKQNRLQQKEEIMKSKSYIDVTLLQNKSYLCILFSISTWNFGLAAAFIHLPNYVTVLSGTNSDISLIMLLFALSNLAGRLLGSLIVSRLHGNCTLLYSCELGISGVLTILFPLYSNLTGGLHFFTVQLGLLTGLPNTMMMAISLEYVGVSKLSEAYGYYFLFCGVGFFTGPVCIGYLFTVSGAYDYSFMAAGAILVFGSLSAGVSICCRRDKATDVRASLYSMPNLNDTELHEGDDTASKTVRSGSLSDLISCSTEMHFKDTHTKCTSDLNDNSSDLKEGNSLLHSQ